MMSRIDYTIIAGAVNDARKVTMAAEAQEGISEVINQLCFSLKIANPRFDEEKFREACNK